MTLEALQYLFYGFLAGYLCGALWSKFLDWLVR